MLRSFLYTQEVPASTWNITHNLGHPPLVDVWVEYMGEMQKILPYQIIHVNMNELQVLFSIPRLGQARLL